MNEIFIVYGITDCPACLRTQADLMERDKEYVFVETDFSINSSRSPDPFLINQVRVNLVNF